jgi:hypothetical protein
LLRFDVNDCSAAIGATAPVRLAGTSKAARRAADLLTQGTAKSKLVGTLHSSAPALVVGFVPHRAEFFRTVSPQVWPLDSITVFIGERVRVARAFGPHGTQFLRDRGPILTSCSDRVASKKTYPIWIPSNSLRDGVFEKSRLARGSAFRPLGAEKILVFTT